MPRYRRWRQAGLSVADLPGAIWIPELGAVTLADADTTVDEWLALYGARPYTTELMEAPAATNRPTWLAGAGVGGRNRVRFDGLDNVLAMLLAKGSNWTQWECGICGELNADGATSDRILTYNAFQRIEEASVANTFRSSSGAGGAAVNFGAVGTTRAHYSMDWTTGAQNNRINGAVSGTATPAALSRADGLAVSVGALDDGSIASNIDLDAFYIMSRVLASSERARLRAWLTGKVGYPC